MTLGWISPLRRCRRRHLRDALPWRIAARTAAGLGRALSPARSSRQGDTPAFRRAAPEWLWGWAWPGDGRRWIGLLACFGLLLLGVTSPVDAAVVAESAPESEAFRCDGVPLTASLHGGAVDDPTIPNRSAGTLPGAFVQLQWQQAAEPIALQLPRTNNAGAPSFTDGKWWWSLEDPDHPRFRLRRGGGDIEDFACERA